MQTAITAQSVIAAASDAMRVKSERLASIDIVRGIAMIIMLVAHATWSVPGATFRLHYGWDSFSKVQVETRPET